MSSKLYTPQIQETIQAIARQQDNFAAYLNFSHNFSVNSAILIFINI
ncbi:MAG: hypothetical protein ACR9NN_15055 [Nostochopsis sp.]